MALSNPELLRTNFITVSRLLCMDVEPPKLNTHEALGFLPQTIYSQRHGEIVCFQSFSRANMEDCEAADNCIRKL